MEEAPNPLLIINAVTDERLIQILVIGLLLVVLSGFSITAKLRGRSNSIYIILPSLLSFGIFLFGDLIEHTSLAAHHHSQTLSGPMDPVSLDTELAKFKTMLGAFRALALFSLLIAVFGAFVHRDQNGHNKAALDNP